MAERAGSDVRHGLTLMFCGEPRYDTPWDFFGNPLTKRFVETDALLIFDERTGEFL
jgi:hypothetical protein